MKSLAKTILLSTLLLGLMGSGEAKPVRVAFLKVVGPSGYVHTAIKNGTPYFENMLLNPTGLTGAASLVNSTLGTGDSILVPRDGFRIDTIGNGKIFTASNVTKFVQLLDSVDVVVLSNTLGFGGIVTSDSDRARFLDFADRKGIVSLHWANDNHSSSSTAPIWAAFDSLCGAMFKDHATANAHMLADSLPFNTTDSEYTFLKSGLGSEYRFNEELMSFTKNVRLLPGVHVLFTLDEKVYTPPTKMGDHPYVWYQNALSGHGGRYFYTGEGHVDSLYSNNYSFRRQFYNAVLWAAGVDRNSAAAVRPAQTKDLRGSIFLTAVSGSVLTVTPVEAGSYKVEVRALDGRRIGCSEAKNGQPTTFSLRPHVLYSITVESNQGRRSSLVVMP